MSKKCVCTPKGLLDEILQSKLDEKDASPELLDIAKGETERQFHGEVPERPDGLTLNEHFDQLNRKMPKGRGLEKQAFRDGLLVSTKRNSNAETTARVEAEYGKKGIQGLGDKALINRTNKRLAELTNTVETPENSFTADNTERTQVLMRELDRRIAKAQADLVDASKLQEARTAIGLAFSEYSNKGGKAVQQITGRDDVQKALDAVMEEAFTPQNKKLKAEIDKAVDSISESEITELLPSVAINNGDVVKRLVDDLDPNDLTLNETEARQKLIENRVAKANETRQLKATEELKVLKKQLDESNKKLEALHNELANIDPIAMLERKSIERIKQDPKGVLGGLIRELAEGRITESQFDNHLRRFPADIVNMMAKTVGCA